MNPIKVAICDRKKAFIYGLSNYLNERKYILVTGGFSTVQDFIIGNKEIASDVLILDEESFREDTIDVVKNLKKQYSNLKIILITFSKSNLYLKKLNQSKIESLISNDATLEDLLNCIVTTYSSKGNLGHDLGLIMYHGLNKTTYTDHTFKKEIRALLTKSEIQILKLIHKGKTAKEMSLLLNKKKSTVDQHRRSLLLKTQSNNLNHLIGKTFKIIKNKEL